MILTWFFLCTNTNETKNLSKNGLERFAQSKPVQLFWNRKKSELKIKKEWKLFGGEMADQRVYLDGLSPAKPVNQRSRYSRSHSSSRRRRSVAIIAHWWSMVDGVVVFYALEHGFHICDRATRWCRAEIGSPVQLPPFVERGLIRAVIWIAFG